ncbi:MAG: phosphate signaling complex protein PhoU [Verrucomicrobiae bacterium]|nr:phosphate signaling complex protein PhoU [Verrucomicrobiae bacterium]MCB1088145.1 phosphate signaling complex protein PhoU [Verrucomicrobiae bacterium]MCB1091219.1 phosphate signaling complex protein PhoU [Verrucomicrobiae bacterium]
MSELSSQPSNHTLGSFDAALRGLRKHVITMASLAGQNLANAVQGLITRNLELCNEAIAADDEVNALERAIDREGMEILMRFNPVASDLREVISSMKIASDLERVSDQAESIARRARKTLKYPEVPETLSIEPVYEMANQMLQDSVRAFSEGDVELGFSLMDRDDALDKIHDKTIKELRKAIERDTENLKTYLHLVFIIRCLERVGDHSVNIAEDAIFAKRATDIRHLSKEDAAAQL